MWKQEGITTSEGIGVLILILMMISWGVNLHRTFTICDFATPYKCEVVHIAGIIIVPASMVTAWVDVGE